MVLEAYGGMDMGYGHNVWTMDMVYGIEYNLYMIRYDSVQIYNFPGLGLSGWLEELKLRKTQSFGLVYCLSIISFPLSSMMQTLSKIHYNSSH